MTVIVANNMNRNGDSERVQVSAGQYFIGCSGSFGGGTAQLFAAVGPKVVAPVRGISYKADSSDLVWLPDCTVFIRLSEAVEPDISVAISELTVRETSQ